MTQCDGLDWQNLRDEFNYDQLWKKKSWNDVARHFVLSLCFSFLPSTFDIVTDCLSAHYFLAGEDYTKRVFNLSDPWAADCRHTGTFIAHTQSGSETLYEEVTCFEKDPIWGSVTLAFIF